MASCLECQFCHRNGSSAYLILGVEGLPKTPLYHISIIQTVFQGSSIGRPDCQETAASRTDVRLIVAEIPTWPVRAL